MSSIRETGGAADQAARATDSLDGDLRKLSVPKEVVFPASVIHKGNYQPYDVAAEQRACPKYEDLIK